MNNWNYERKIARDVCTRLAVARLFNMRANIEVLEYPDKSCWFPSWKFIIIYVQLPLERTLVQLNTNRFVNLPTKIFYFKHSSGGRLIRTEALSICISNMSTFNEMIERLCTPSPEIWCLLQFATEFFARHTFAGDGIWFELCVFFLFGIMHLITKLVERENKMETK